MTFISETFKFIGSVVGETVHQTGELVGGTYNVASDIVEDISNIPSAIVDGYNEELFEAKTTDPNAVVDTKVSEPYVEQS